MEHERYEYVEISDNMHEFVCISIGPKGMIRKIIQFVKTEETVIFNLLLGDDNGDGTIMIEQSRDCTECYSLLI